MGHHLRFRQIHLDFHTSPKIPGIGQNFDKAAWQETLRNGHVNSITCFATGHHGWSYYHTNVGDMHPNLEFDLLRSQFDACKEIDVNVPIYLTAGVNNWASHNHPEWREIGADGSYCGWTQRIIDPGFHSMCFNTPYLNLLCRQIEEVVTLFPDCDGIFLDIINQNQCCCKWCLEGMEEAGLDAGIEADRITWSKKVLLEYYRRATNAAKSNDTAMPIFHNSGHISVGKRDLLQYFSHLELESLPTGGWGYDHFPLSAKYVKGLDLDFLGMTGKFHTTWGEFGGYKHPNALRYECAAMLAFGSKCSVGDQLHPRGGLDESTYAIIGQAYKEVEEKEPWCDNVEAVSDMAILSVVSTNPTESRESYADTGAGRILLEGHLLFDVIDTKADFSKYKLIILPDEVIVNRKLKEKLDDYLSAGGKLMLTGKSGLDEEKEEFLFDIGAKCKGIHEYSPDYLQPAKETAPDFINSPMVMYQPAVKLESLSQGAISLGKVLPSYFNRNFRHFCSHQHTPQNPEGKTYEAGTINGNILYLAHPVFTLYRGYGAVAVKEFVLNAIHFFMRDEIMVKTNLPSQGRISLMNQQQEGRYILHLLFANKLYRGGDVELSGGTTSVTTKGLEVIEELLPLRGTSIEIGLTEDIKETTLEPGGKRVDFIRKDGVCKLTIEEFTCHQMVVFQY